MTTEIEDKEKVVKPKKPKFSIVNGTGLGKNGSSAIKESGSGYFINLKVGSEPANGIVCTVTFKKSIREKFISIIPQNEDAAALTLFAAKVDDKSFNLKMSPAGARMKAGSRPELGVVLL